LAKVFPWVVTESKYAGRLSGFDTKGSDLIYLATDFGPFALTVLLGVPLMKLCTRRGRPVLLPIAIVLGLAPFYNLTGDYYEMGSIITTRLATVAFGPRYAAPPPEPMPVEDEIGEAPRALAEKSEPADPGAGGPPGSVGAGRPESAGVIVGGDTDAAFAGLRSDDIFSLFANFFGSPSVLGIHGPGQFTAGLGIILVGLALAIILAFGTYFLGHLWSRVILPGSRP
jgi:hypothetical protein